MTRINCVPPEELHDRFLVAEYHELPRVFGLVRKAIERGAKPDNYAIFDHYTMGTGHVKFFYTRLKWLAVRQALLIAEMINRGMKPQYENFTDIMAGIPAGWFGDWEPDEADMTINRGRLAERLKEMESKAKRKVITPYNEHELMEQ